MAAALPALPVFLLGCVIALLVVQFRLANLQAATVGYGASWPPTATQPSTVPTPDRLIAAKQQLQAAAGDSHQAPPPPKQEAAAAVDKDTLVIYVLNEDDPLYRDNFEYFLLAGVQQDSR